MKLSTFCVHASFFLQTFRFEVVHFSCSDFGFLDHFSSLSMAIDSEYIDSCLKAVKDAICNSKPGAEEKVLGLLNNILRITDDYINEESEQNSVNFFIFFVE